ncbi:hypothetical protein DYH09_12380 [bacterium CPR1]|nr:hypothetical protein [bacterium CPR1]
MNATYQSSIKFHPQRSQLSISKEGSAMCYDLETNGGSSVKISVADTVEDPHLHAFKDRDIDLGTMQKELQAVVTPVADKARSASRLGRILGGVGLVAAGACALAGLGTVAVAGVAVLGIGAFVAGQKKAQSILAPVRNCIDLGWTLNTMKDAPAQPGFFQSSSAGQHASNPNFLRS